MYEVVSKRFMTRSGEFEELDSFSGQGHQSRFRLLCFEAFDGARSVKATGSVYPRILD